MNSINRIIRRPCCLLLLLLAALPASLHADDSGFQTVHWAYSAFFGTGWYQIDDNRSVFALNLPFRQTVRPSSITKSGQRKIGFEIHYPLTLGFHNIDDLPGIIEPDNFGTITFTPGLELEIPLSQRWYLRPFINVGWGNELQTNNSSWIYYSGIKSRFTFPADTDNWSLINNLYYAGYNPEIGKSDDLAALLTAVEYRQVLKHSRSSGKPIDLHWSLGYSYLFNDLDFAQTKGGFDSFNDQFIAGLAYSRRNDPFKLGWLKFSRIGLEYRFSSNRTFNGISLNFNSLFKR